MRKNLVRDCSRCPQSVKMKYADQIATSSFKTKSDEVSLNLQSLIDRPKKNNVHIALNMPEDCSDENDDDTDEVECTTDRLQIHLYFSA